jgi:hypothetical protein
MGYYRMVRGPGLAIDEAVGIDAAGLVKSS